MNNSKINNIEAVNGNLIQLAKENKCIEIKNLTKVYSNGKKAVDNLNLTIYDS